MSNKIIFSYNQIHTIIQNLAQKILQQYNPDIIIAISGGGLIPSRILRTYLDCEILCVGIKLYNGNIQNPIPVKTQWFAKNFDKLKGKNILIVDEIDDTRRTLSYVIDEIEIYNPNDIAIAVIHNKIKNKAYKFPKQYKYFSGEDILDEWIVYPWEQTNINSIN